jgi:hypothetical protein
VLGGSSGPLGEVPADFLAVAGPTAFPCSMTLIPMFFLGTTAGTRAANTGRFF